MSTQPLSNPQAQTDPSLVLYCLTVRHDPDGQTRFLLCQKQGSPSFPATKLKQAEDLYDALVRPMQEDIKLAPGTYFPETELPAIHNAGESPRYPGLPKEWLLYPVVVSVKTEERQRVLDQAGPHFWWTLDEVLARATEPNIHAIVKLLQTKDAEIVKDKRADFIRKLPEVPTMDALAGRWARDNDRGVRLLRGAQIEQIIAAGNRAFNLRVADPYLPYQRQGLGFTWSFFTPKDKQDVHVHGMPAVEIYGVLRGRLMLWAKPMTQRGVGAWTPRVLEAGDWIEVEPLQCHFACWLGRDGLGVVIKAARAGELGGVGRLGASGKTTCTWTDEHEKEAHCMAHGQCQFPPVMKMLIAEYAKDYDKRNYSNIKAVL
jgi:hypothetical protein